MAIVQKGGAKGDSPGRSGLQRPSPQRTRDPDQTDPEAVLADEPEDVDEEGTAVDGVVESVEDEPSSGDKTQVYDPGNEAPLAPKFKALVLAGPKAGAEFALDRELTVGRSAENGISIPDVSVSRRHLKLVVEGDGVRFEDLGSGNGTKLNDEKVEEGVARHGDEIAVGDTVLQIVEEGMPTAKKGAKPRKTPQAPSGQLGAPGASTRGDMPKVPKPSPPAAKGAAPSGAVAPARRGLYVIAAVVLVVVFGAGILRNRSASAARKAAEKAENENAGSVKEALAEARRLIKKNDWKGAYEIYKDVYDQTGDESLAENVARTKSEADYQVKLEQAKGATANGDFLGAAALLRSVPDTSAVYDQVKGALDAVEKGAASRAEDARRALAEGDKDRARTLAKTVLAYDASNTVALGVVAEADKKATKATPVRVTVQKKTDPERDTKPVAANGPAVAAYLAGDVARALRLAEDSSDDGGKLLKQLRSFDTNYREGIARAQAQRAAEAVKALGAAERIDREISMGRPSKPGKEVGKQLANMEYLLGIDCKGDEQLDCAARHFRAGVEADPDHELSKKMLRKTYDRAKELYMEAYLLKGTEPERAKKMFKKVADTLPQSEEFWEKAKRWFDKLNGTKTD